MKYRLLLFVVLLFTQNIFAADKVINLTVSYKTVNFAGKPRKAIAVNNQIPAPTLHFKEGDRVTINVHNMLDKETAIHWHGMLVPWQMDGVKGITQAGIQPNQTFKYQFTLYQSGTYWYHAHAGLQEQQGLYGAFVIDPPKSPNYKYTKDYVVVLSDWSNTDPDQILANLKKEGDYYSPDFPLQPSLMKFIHDFRKANASERKQLVDDYKMMQQMRMSIYDLSDVAYDAFLLNGKPKCQPWTGNVKVGDVVRLRFIGAGGSTIFHVKIHDSIMQMVHIEGNDVVPYNISDFTIAPGETYDVLVKITNNKPYIIYAESNDTVGAAYGALVTSPNQFVNYKGVPSFPEPLPVTREMMSMMMGDAIHNQPQMKPVAEHTHSTHGMSSKMKMSHDMPMENNKSTNDSMSGMQMDPNMKMDNDMQGSSSEDKSGASKNINNTQANPASHENHSQHSDMKMMDMGNMSGDMQMGGNKNSNDSMSGMQMDPNMKMDHNMSGSSSENKGDASKNTNNTQAKQTSHENHNQHSNMKMMDMSGMSPNMPMDGMKMDHAKHGSNAAQMNMSDHMMMGTGNSMQGMSMEHGMHGGMHMDMPIEPTVIGDRLTRPTTSTYTTSSGTKYQNVRAAVKTNDPNKPVTEVINMELFGYMDRYIWFINGLPEYKTHPIVLKPGQRYRFVFTNNSMMHHPMHIHGHWFIFRKGNGAYDPLLHTIDVAPGATITADVDTDASGQWLFHCHFLYHMMAGMSRTFQYSTLIEITRDEAKPENVVKQTGYYNRPIVRIDEVRPIDPMLVHHPMAHEVGLWLATYLDVGADPFNNSQRLTYKGMYGYDYNKLELFINDAEMAKGTVENADIDIFYWHLLSQFWAVKGGANYFYRPAHAPYWQPGIAIEGLMPYYIDTDVRGYYYGGSAKLDIELSRDTQITNNFLIRAGIRSILASKTVSQAEIGSGLNQMRFIVRPYYRLMPAINVFVEYEHEQDYGAYKNLQSQAGESAVQNTLTLGLTALF